MSGKIWPATEEARVLIVEDEPRLRNLLISTIPEMGFRANAVASANDALGVMEGQAHEIVVLDLNLPGMDGLEFCEILHDRWPNTRVIILTGFGDLEGAQRAIRLGVVDFLTKPASLSDLEMALDRARRGLGGSVGPLPGAMVPRPADQEARDQSEHPLQELERDLILAALARHNGNREATATELDISLRTLYYRLAEYRRQGFAT